ncbi:hypothetical protein PCANC_06404 [Puccinia coronata f. sp. avenae]|uniref:Uncharacterized protein n=1 Tax=Puccinia coronata f. sp. avenae TaxID=200324 RepID=A0A2N5VVV8_9BASI|nr:hypothetical protein PCASD_20252 [Puccinia coronata f. sp. avenae]PLW54119.1 hypothetical protein PCANC_06404 [Puccinia coronata f. sp. avenae]
MSELTGSAATIDKILSPGTSRIKAPPPVFTNTTSNSTQAEKSRTADSTTDYYGSTCSISFATKGARNREPRSLQEKILRRSLDPSLLLGDDDAERSALFLTDTAAKCVEASRRWGSTAGFPLGVGVCYSIGYVDEQRSSVGGEIIAFRLGTVDELSSMSGMDIEQLQDTSRLELSFLSQNSPDETTHYSRASREGALRLSQPSWAPSDDPAHLINPSNPQYTASYGHTQMVLIGSFHMNLLDDHLTHMPLRIRKRDHAEPLLPVSPSGARLVSRDTPVLQSHFFDLSNHHAKRSALAGAHPWGLFKRQAVTSISSNTEFSSDAACSDAGLSPNRFFSGDGTESPRSPDAASPRSLQVSTTPSRPPPIPPSPYVSAASREVNANFTVPSNFRRANSIVSVNSINFNVTAFQLPGRYLMVNPIGLIIYGGFSSVVLMVFIMVTYERTQYRSMFRRRLKEQQAHPSSHYDNFSDRRV